MSYLKICGIRSHEDYKVIQDRKPDFAGFIFADSKRRVSPEQVSGWIHSESNMKHIGVFVNPSIIQIQKTLQKVNLDVIQLHGNESKAFINKIRALTDMDIWKAIPHTNKTLDLMEHYSDLVNGFVIDTKVKGKWGGTGIRFDWTSIPEYTAFGRSYNKICMIAGGIDPKNVVECLSHGPIGMDLSSGVERENRKDPLKINELMERMYRYEHGFSR